MTDVETAREVRALGLAPDQLAATQRELEIMEQISREVEQELTRPWICTSCGRVRTDPGSCTQCRRWKQKKSTAGGVALLVVLGIILIIAIAGGGEQGGGGVKHSISSGTSSAAPNIQLIRERGEMCERLEPHTEVAQSNCEIELEAAAEYAGERFGR